MIMSADDLSQTSVTKMQPIARKLRVLYFDHTSLLSGGELALLEAIRKVDRTTVDPLIVLGEHGPLEEEIAPIAPVWVLKLPSALSNTRKDTLTGVNRGLLRKVLLSVPYIFRLTRLFRELEPDIVHTNSLKADLLGGIAARLAGVRLVWHVRDRISPDYLPEVAGRGFRFLVRWMPHYVVGCSQSVIDTLKLPPTKPHKVVYSGIDLADYEFRRPDLRPLERQPATGQKPIFIGMVGRLGPWKGQHTFIKAASTVHKKFPQARFLLYGTAMFGESEYESTLHAMVKELGLETIVEFKGFERNIAQAIVNLDFLVHASVTPEPFGQVIVQGMAAGKAVIASEGGGASEIIRHGIDGLLFERGNSEALTDALLRLLSDEDFAMLIARNGRERVRSKFTIETTVATLSSVFQEMASRP
jgi:glycosyltransferase involved in cell wall biosynthesis